MKKWIGILVGGLILGGQPLWADSREADGQSVMMDEVVVTAGRLAEPLRSQTASVLIIDGHEIATSPARNLGDLLAQKGLGYIKKYPGGLTSMGIRGFKTDTHGNDLRGHVLVLLDGRRAGTGNVAKISTANIQRLEIIRGPAAVQYGSAAMGGVVNVITRQGQKEPAAQVRVTLASHGGSEAAMALSGQQGSLDYAAAFSRATLDDYQDGSGQTFSNSGYHRQDAYSANLGYAFHPDQRLGLIITGYEGDHLGNPGSLSQNDLDNYKDARLYSGDLVYSGAHKEKLSWLLRYFQGQDRDLWHDPVASNASGWDNGIAAMQKTAHQGSQVQGSMDLDWAQVTAGLDWADYAMENTWTPQETEYENRAGFILVKGRFLDQRLIVDGGLRYDTYEVAMLEPAGQREKESRLTPSVGMAYLLSRAWQARLHYGQAFVMPGADQLAADYTTWGRHYRGNPHLRPESSRTWEAGIHYYGPLLAAGLSSFHTSFDDKIEVVAVEGIYSWDNVGRATVGGVEGEFSCDIGAWLAWPYEVKLFAGLLYHHTYEDQVTQQDLKYIHEWQGSCGLSVTDYDGFSGRLSFTYSGPQIIDDRQSSIVPTPVVEKGGFTVAQVSVVKRLLALDKAGALSLRADIANLLDTEYAYVKGYPMPGRVFSLGLEWGY
ncbi:MAG: TonB-dependent receptor [Deltaproteobacteria bacterium]|jgi:vitamin B12 transporter|nr:TonB-dependent receptor [Deltaproteobacteria bacterium]